MVFMVVLRRKCIFFYLGYFDILWHSEPKLGYLRKLGLHKQRQLHFKSPSSISTKKVHYSTIYFLKNVSTWQAFFVKNANSNDWMRPQWYDTNKKVVLILMCTLTWIFKQFRYPKWFLQSSCRKKAGPLEPFLSKVCFSQ